MGFLSRPKDTTASRFYWRFGLKSHIFGPVTQVFQTTCRPRRSLGKPTSQERSWVRETTARLHRVSSLRPTPCKLSFRAACRSSPLPSQNYPHRLSTILTSSSTPCPSSRLLQPLPPLSLSAEAAIKATLGAAARPQRSRQSNAIRLLRRAKGTPGGL